MGLLGTLFGKPAKNQAYDYTKDSLNPAVQAGVGGITDAANALNGGFGKYMDDSGFNFALGEGLRGVTGAGAAKGMLRSGATQKALLRYGTGLKQQSYDNFLNKQLQLGQLGLGAAGITAGAGSKGATGGVVDGLTKLFSDPRVKVDMRPVGRLDNGLTVYAFCYEGAPMTTIGLNADEVEELHPEAVSVAKWFGPGKMNGEQVKVVDYALAVLPVEEKEADNA